MRAHAAALAGLAALVGLTAAWWALALWPLPAEAPGWLERTRAVCFGTTASGLPDASGWLALVLQPATMAILLAAIAGREVASGLRALAATAAGRAALAAGGALVLAGGGAAAWRVAAAVPAEAARLAPPSADWIVRLEGPAPPLRLTDQNGTAFDLADLAGRPVLVVFAFAHCRTVCPLLVRDALAAQRAAGEVAPAVVVVTLDPWRDTPARLPHIARAWGLGDDAWALSGPVDEVESALDAWEIGRARDPRDGDVVHAPRVFVVDHGGRLAYATPGGADTLVELVRGL